MGHVLVTGGAGFIGSHLIDALVAQGDTVVALDNFSTGTPENLSAASKTGRVQVINGDVTNPADLDRAMAGAHAVFHCAAKTGVRECLDDWLGAHRVNASGTVAEFQAAHRFGNVPVVYASSAAVYGNRDSMICHEKLQPRPISSYGVDKLTCELQAQAFWNVHGLPTAGLRFFNVFGPRQNATSPYSGALVKFASNVLSGQDHVVFGDGHQSRDFVHVRDAVSGLRAAMQRVTASPDALVSNLCTGRSISILQLIETIAEIHNNSRPEIAFYPARSGEIRHSRGDTSLMRDLLGLGSCLPLEDGIADYMTWRRDQGKMGEEPPNMRETGS